MKTLFRPLLSLFLASLTLPASAGTLPELTDGAPISLSDLDASETSWLVNYPGLNGRRECLIVEVGYASGTTVDVPFLMSQIVGYDGPRLLFGSLDYPVERLVPRTFGLDTFQFRLSRLGAYQTGIALRTTEIGESFRELVKRATRGPETAVVKFRLDACLRHTRPTPF